MMTTQRPDAERVRGYLLSQGERYSFTQLWPRAMHARLQVIDALDGLSEAQASYKPAPSEWSIRDVALHLADSSANTRSLVEKLATGQAGDASGIEAGMVAATQSVEELRMRLVEDGIAWSAMTQRLSAEVSLEPLAPHPFFGQLHCRAWYLFQRVHDLDHFNQIEAVKKSEGYPPTPN